ncbi:GNAT family N-acetyltransferase [Mycoplasmatota bacterium WC44]
MLSGYVDTKLTKEKVKELLKLLETCNKYDGTKMQLYLNNRDDGDYKDYLYYNSDQLLGYLVVYPSYREGEVQVTGLVHPNSRRSGVFTHLLNSAITDVKEDKNTIRFIKDCNSQSGLSFLNYIGAKYIESSYTMQYQAGKIHEFTNSLLISNAKMNEIDKLVEIGIEAFGTKEEEERPLVKTNIENDNRHLLVGYLNDQIIGCVLASIEDGKATIGDLAVKKEYRKRGFGRELLYYIIKDVKELGVDEMHLSVYIDNENALSLYESCGFTVKNALEFYKFNL